MYKLLITMCIVTLTGCTGMNDTQQRMVSGAAVGGTLAGLPGAMIGSGIGWMIDVGDQSKYRNYNEYVRFSGSEKAPVTLILNGE